MIFFWYICHPDEQALSISSRSVTVHVVCDVFVQVKSIGQVLFDEVSGKQQLQESDYFGLQYTDPESIPVSHPIFCYAHVYEVWLCTSGVRYGQLMVTYAAGKHDMMP